MGVEWAGWEGGGRLSIPLDIASLKGTVLGGSSSSKYKCPVEDTKKHKEALHKVTEQLNSKDKTIVCGHWLLC